MEEHRALLEVSFCKAMRGCVWNSWKDQGSTTCPGRQRYGKSDGICFVKKLYKCHNTRPDSNVIAANQLTVLFVFLFSFFLFFWGGIVARAAQGQKEGAMRHDSAWQQTKCLTIFDYCVDLFYFFAGCEQMLSAKT